MVLPVIPLFRETFDVSLGVAAQVVSGFIVGRLVGTPLAGIAVDRIGTRLSLVLGPGLATVAALASAATPWFSIIIAAAFVVGIGESLWAFGREIAGIDLVSLEQRGQVLSGFHGVHAAGLALGPLSGGIIADQIGLRAVFLTFAAVSAIAVVLALAATSSRPTRGTNPERASRQRRSLSMTDGARALGGLFMQIDPRLRATYAVLVFATFSGFLFRMTMQSILPLHADVNAGLSATQIGALFSISAVLITSLTLPVGIIIDKVGRKWATVPSTTLPGIAFLLMPFADSFLLLAIIVSLLGLANGLSLGSLATSTYDVVPASARGRLQALRRTVAEFGGLTAPVLGGLLADAFNPSVPFVVFAPVILLAGGLLAFVGKETLVRPGAVVKVGLDR